MARDPNKTWELLDHAMIHYQKHISDKKRRNSLTIVDLLYVSNFKGGNASITEPIETLAGKLIHYEVALEEIDRQFKDKTLAKLTDKETNRLIELCNKVTALTNSASYKIRGFGASYVSALLAAHFPKVIPVLDRRILNGASISVEYDSQKQVKNIAQHYGDLIKACRMELRKKKGLTLRELDKVWFAKPLN